MKVQESTTGRKERIVLSAMILDESALARLTPVWVPDFFSNDYANLVGTWCVKFYQRYGKAPGVRITERFYDWSEDRGEDDGLVATVGAFLTALSDEADNPDPPTVEYVLDAAGQLVQENTLRRLSEQIEANLDVGNLEKASEVLSNYRPIEIGSANGVNLLEDFAAWEQAFTSRTDGLFKLPGAVGKFYGNSLRREGFISMCGRAKIGKSWFLFDMAYQALINGLNVALFSVGDMSQDDVMLRFGSRVAKHPAPGVEFPVVCNYPKELQIDPDRETKVLRSKRRFEEALTVEDAKKHLMALNELDTTGSIKLFTYPNISITAEGVRSVLLTQADADWVADVVVLDYMDILKKPSSGNDGRDGINDNWATMRRISQELHGLVFTATQADAKSYSSSLLTMENFSDDRRKNDHVTGMVGINQTIVEKRQQLYRLNWMLTRDGEWPTDRCVSCAAALAVANPYVVSSF